MTDPLDIVAEIAQQQQNADAAAREQRLSVEDIRWLMGDKRGRRFMWRLLTRCGAFRGGFTDSALLAAYNAGQRDIGLQQLAEVTTHAADQYLVMMKESKNDNGSAS